MPNILHKLKLKTMKPLVKMFLLLLLPVVAMGQNFNVDSLKNALKTAPTDSVAFNLNIQLADYYKERNRDTALYYLEKCFVLALRNNKKLDEALVLSFKGYQFMHLGKLPESYQCISQALNIAENAQNDSKTFGLIPIFNPNWTPHQIRLSILSTVLHFYGHLLGRMGKTDQQIIHYNESIKISESIGDSAEVGVIFMNLGSTYYKLGKLDSALLLEQSAENILRQTNQKTYLGMVYNNLGKIYLKQKKNVQAVQYFHKGIESAIEQKNEATLGTLYSSLTKFYLKSEKNGDSSLYYAVKTLGFLESMGSNDLADIYSELSDSYALHNNPDSAFKYKKLAFNSLDSATKSRIESLTKAQSLAFDDQLKLKAIEKEHADAQNKIRTIALLAGLGIMFLVGFLLYRNNRQKQKANELLQKQKEEIEKQKAIVESTLKELKATQNQLIQSEKLASLGELTAGIAHEIQNPLNFVNNFAELSVDLAKDINSEIRKPEMDKDYLEELLTDLTHNQEKINLHGKRASSIVKGMLEHSRASTGLKELTDINKLCDEYFRLAYHGLRAKDKDFNCELISKFDETLPKIEIIPQDVGRVVLNLINNAFYAVIERANQKRSGNFESSLNVENLRGYKPIVSVTTQKTDNGIEIRVKDNGTGMPESVKEKIFQPFFTTKPTGSGTGLGLSLAYDIITKGHSGTLTVESVEGNGSAFIISLPL